MTVFISYVLVYAAYLCVGRLVLAAPDASMQYCYFVITDWYLSLSVKVVNVVTLILFTYMSVIFSRPLNDYWEEFLLSYRRQSLSQAI